MLNIRVSISIEDVRTGREVEVIERAEYTTSDRVAPLVDAATVAALKGLRG